MDSQINKRLAAQSRSGQPNPESLPIYYQGYDSLSGLTIGKSPILGMIKGEKIGNVAVAFGDPMQLQLTEGLPRFVTPTIDRSPPPSPIEKNYQIVYFYRFEVTLGSALLFSMQYEDWPDREQFLVDGIFPIDHELTISNSLGSVVSTQRRNTFSIVARIAYPSWFSPPDLKELAVTGFLEVWGNTKDIVIERGASYVRLLPEREFNLFFGNPSTRRVSGVIQSNNRFRGFINGFPSVPFGVGDALSNMICEIDLCLTYSDRLPGETIVLNIGTYTNSAACSYI